MGSISLEEFLLGIQHVFNKTVDEVLVYSSNEDMNYFGNQLYVNLNRFRNSYRFDYIVMCNLHWYETRDGNVKVVYELNNSIEKHEYHFYNTKFTKLNTDITWK